MMRKTRENTRVFTYNNALIAPSQPCQRLQTVVENYPASTHSHSGTAPSPAAATRTPRQAPARSVRSLARRRWAAMESWSWGDRWAESRDSTGVVQVGLPGGYAPGH